MRIVVRLKVPELRAGGMVSDRTEMECGGVSVDNDGDLIIVDDKEGVIGVVEARDWDHFVFYNNESEKPVHIPADSVGSGGSATASTYGDGGLAR